MSFCRLLAAESTVQAGSFNGNFQQKGLLSLSRQICQLSRTSSRYPEGLLGLRPVFSLLSRITALGIASLAALSTVRGLEPVGGPTFRINTDLAGNQETPKVAVLSNDSFVVTWYGDGVGGDSEDIYCRRYSAKGIPLDSSAFRINTDLTSSQFLPSLAALLNGGFVVTWQGAGVGGEGADIYGKRFSAAGTPLDGSAFRINTDLPRNQEDSSVAALPDGGFVVTWSSSGLGVNAYDIYGRRYNAAGAPLDNPAFLINTDLTGFQREPKLAALSDGSFVVTWYGDGSEGNSDDVYGRRYNAAGTPLDGSAFRINTDLAGFQVKPSVAALSDGGFVVTWYGEGLGSVLYDIYGRRYSAAGIPLDGSAFRINTDLDGVQQDPNVAGLPDGGFVVTWRGAGDGGDSDDIYGRRYNATGIPLDSTAFRINTDLAGDQLNPNVAALSDGSFAVTWQGPGGGSNGIDIYGRIFSTAITVPTTTGSSMTSPSDNPAERIETTHTLWTSVVSEPPIVNLTSTTLPTIGQPTNPLGASLAATITILACCLLSALGIYLMHRLYLRRRVHSANQAQSQPASPRLPQSYETVPTRDDLTDDQVYQQIQLRENTGSSGSLPQAERQSASYQLAQAYDDAPPQRSGVAANQEYQQLELREHTISSGFSATSPSYEHQRESRSGSGGYNSGTSSSPSPQYDIPTDWRHA